MAAPSDRRGDESKDAVERGGGGGSDQQGEEVTGGLRVEGERGDASEAAAGHHFEGALGAVQILAITKAEVNDGNSEKGEEGHHRGGEPDG
jgi:hypothetical protein